MTWMKVGKEVPYNNHRHHHQAPLFFQKICVSALVLCFDNGYAPVLVKDSKRGIRSSYECLWSECNNVQPYYFF